MSLRWAHILFCWFCHAATHFIALLLDAMGVELEVELILIGVNFMYMNGERLYHKKDDTYWTQRVSSAEATYDKC